MESPKPTEGQEVVSGGFKAITGNGRRKKTANPAIQREGEEARRRSDQALIRLQKIRAATDGEEDIPAYARCRWKSSAANTWPSWARPIPVPVDESDRSALDTPTGRRVRAHGVQVKPNYDNNWRRFATRKSFHFFLQPATALDALRNVELPLILLRYAGRPSDTRWLSRPLRNVRPRRPDQNRPMSCPAARAATRPRWPAP